MQLLLTRVRTGCKLRRRPEQLRKDGRRVNQVQQVNTYTCTGFNMLMTCLELECNLNKGTQQCGFVVISFS